MVYGEGYLSYGNTGCSNCGQPHAIAYHIPETPQSRFKLMQFIAEMGTINAPGHAPVVNAGAGQKFMVGLLIAGGRTLVTVSGNNLLSGAFVDAARRKGYEICPARKPLVGVHKTFSGRVVPAEQYGAAQAAGASGAGDCAAPRLIERAFELFPVGSAARAANTWAMSEVFYQPNTARRTRDDLLWIHGLSAYSCATCANLVPLLLCPAP